MIWLALRLLIEAVLGVRAERRCGVSWQLFNGDCIEGLRGLADRSVDAEVCK